jgi:hypothetical protein
MSKKLTWLIAHHPAHLFVRTAEAFNEELEKTLPGQFEIEVLTMPEYMEQRGDIPELALKPKTVAGLEEGEATSLTGGFVSSEWKDIKTKWGAFFQGIRDKKIHLSQTQVTVIGSHLFPMFKTLDLPYLFKDHDHVSKVLDGQVGASLLNEMGNTTGIRGLGYTYSGGYRIVGSNKEIANLAALEKMVVTTTPNTKLFFKSLAKDAIGRVEQSLEQAYEGDSVEADAVETTYLRFSGKHILKTEHSMFLTSIVIGDEFFNELSTEQQKAFQAAAKIVAKKERVWSLEDAARYEAEALEKGVTITEVSEEETSTMKNRAPADHSALFNKVPGTFDIAQSIIREA